MYKTLYVQNEFILSAYLSIIFFLFIPEGQKYPLYLTLLYQTHQNVFLSFFFDKYPIIYLLIFVLISLAKRGAVTNF